MNTLKEIHDKLARFLRKYYLNELLKGLFLFVCIGLLYMMCIVLLEYILWLSPLGRLILFWAFVGIEVVFLVKFIVVPLLYLFKLRKGIDHFKASQIIGDHFPEVNDKLLNFLQLSQNKAQSDLLVASIEQKGLELKPIPFQLAVSYKKNLKYAYYAAIPVFLLIAVILIGKISPFTASYKRMVDYTTAYSPPAPFEFLILNDSLKTIKGKPFTLQVQTAGTRIPEDIQIIVENQRFFMEKKENGTHQYTFQQPLESKQFRLTATQVSSKDYALEVIPTPSLLSFEMTLDYPNYTGKTTQTLKSTGNATIPEGTTVHWKFNTENTASIILELEDSLRQLTKTQQSFSLKSTIYNTTAYSVSTSNEHLKNHEKLAFKISVVKDRYPTISVKEHTDSTTINRKIYSGVLSDDYGIDKFEIHYRVKGSDSLLKAVIPIKKTTVDRFVYTFPGKLQLEASVPYEFHFELTDNDALRGGKTTKSKTFSYQKLSSSELQDKQLEVQKETINQLQNTIKQSETQKQQLKEINDVNKQKNQLNFNDKKRIDQFLSREQQQNEMMEKFQNKLKENLSEFQKQNQEESAQNKLLQERLERQQKQLEKNELQMEKLRELTDKINKEDLSKRLEEMAKMQNNNSRSLEQILELTKRYYVEAKTEKLKKDIQSLAKQQTELSESPDQNQTDQEKLNNEFEKIQQQLDQLEKENQDLKKPMEISRDPETEKQIKNEQNDALEKLEQQPSQNKAQPHQIKAGEKLRELGENMSSAMQSASRETLEEDAKMLRQILDNLVLFSLNQESLLKRMGALTETKTNLSVYLKEQNDLKSVFEHVDDSLFALSLRQPKLTEQINSDVSDVFYNINKSLEEFAENRTYQGVSYQQYTLTATNSLADFLSNILDNMQQSLSMGSGGGPKDFQLPDIIQSQEQLNKRMQQGGENQKQGQQQNGKEGEEGESENKQSGSQMQNEKMSGELFEIYKQQHFLRNALEKQTEKITNSSDKLAAKKLIEEMKQLEDNLIEQGFSNANEQKMLQLQHQLLKLEDAAMEQGQKPERESNFNEQEFSNPTKEITPELQQYFNEVEILNRQSLPLRQIYKEKVNTYFKTDD